MNGTETVDERYITACTVPIVLGEYRLENGFRHLIAGKTLWLTLEIVSHSLDETDGSY